IPPDVVITQQADWQKFTTGRKGDQNPPDIIVDPMVFRSADIFLRGEKRAQDALPGKTINEIWTALNENVGSLIAFFDALILYERLLIIDYGITFESQIGFDQDELYRRVNEAAADKVLVAVHVVAPASQEAKNSALTLLRERPKIPAALGKSILQEMSAFDYA